MREKMLQSQGVLSGTRAVKERVIGGLRGRLRDKKSKEIVVRAPSKSAGVKDKGRGPRRGS